MGRKNWEKGGEGGGGGEGSGWQDRVKQAGRRRGGVRWRRRATEFSHVIGTAAAQFPRDGPEPTIATARRPYLFVYDDNMINQ